MSVRALSRFNSTLVQLKVEEVKRGQDDLIMFQFYLSSIKRQNEEVTQREAFKFQFYLSSIKSGNIIVGNLGYPCFNSTLVQLKAG